MKIEKAEKTGFCFGVRRALEIVEKAAKERGNVETLGEVVHNRQVVQKLAQLGVSVAETVDDVKGKCLVISAHGVRPRLEEQLRAKQLDVIDATCPFVRSAQQAAKHFADDGFFVVVYGDPEHPEVKGILGWADDKGMATKDAQTVTALKPLPKRIGILSQTTQVPADFREFAKKIIDAVLDRGSEIRIIDTICHDIRRRQESALEVAGRVDVMVVVGGRTSANTKHLTELCSRVVTTYMVQDADELRPEWFKGVTRVGVTAGASTSDETIDEVVAALEQMGAQKTKTPRLKKRGV